MENSVPYNFKETERQCKWCLEMNSDYCKGTKGYTPHCVYSANRKRYLQEKYGEEWLKERGLEGG